MKTFNTIACIIVLVLALVSAVCSYFLYEKRVQFVDGWNQMSEAIHTSAKTIDQRGNDKFASKLTVDELSHKKYSKDALAGKLKNLTKQSEAFVAQYDELTKKFEDMTALQKKTQAQLNAKTLQCNAMADALASIGSAVNANAGSASAFTNGNSYVGAVGKVRAGVEKFVTSSRNLANQVVALAAEHKVSYKSEDLFVNPDLTRIKLVLRKYNTATENYRKALETVARSVNVKFDANSINKVSDGVKNMSSDLSKTRNALSSSQKMVTRHETTISGKNSEIGRLKGVIADYKRVLNIDPADTDPKVWKRGSVEARTALDGKVIAVDKGYGYIVIDFGNQTIVKQMVGNKEHAVNADVEAGLSFNIIRDGKFIASINLSNVDAAQSTANIPASKIDQIKVGDKVVFNAAQK
jgi:hypothetical protein